MIKKLFFEKTEKLHFQFFRYLISSGISLIADYLLTIFLKEFLNIHYLIASTSGNILGLIINYLLSISWVFNTRKIENKKVEFLIFILTSIVGMIITQFLVYFFTEFLKFHYIISKTVSIFFGYIVRFILRKKILF